MIDIYCDLAISAGSSCVRNAGRGMQAHRCFDYLGSNL